MKCFRTPVHVGGCAAPRFGRAAHPWHRGALVGWSLSPRERRTKTPVVRSTNTVPSNACGVGHISPATSDVNHPVSLSVRMAVIARLPPGARRFCGRRRPRKPTGILRRVCCGKPAPVFSRGGLHLQPNRLTETTVAVRTCGRNSQPLAAPTLRRRVRLGCRRPTSPVQPPASHGTHGTPVPSWLARLSPSPHRLGTSVA